MGSLERSERTIGAGRYRGSAVVRCQECCGQESTETAHSEECSCPEVAHCMPAKSPVVPRGVTDVRLMMEAGSKMEVYF